MGDSSSRSRIFDGLAKPLFSRGRTQVHVTTLDEVVSVNSFFTVAVFIGMTFTSRDAYSLENNESCKASTDNTMKRLLVFEVVSFSCFLFSSLVAHGMKLFIVFSNSKDRGEIHSAAINNNFLCSGMLASAIGSVAGTLLLMLSMVNIIQLRLGSLDCEDGWADAAAVPLIVLVITGITIFISSVFYAFFH